MSEVLLQQILSELKDVKSGQQSMDKRFNKVDERFNKVDERFDKMDNRFNKVDERFDKVDERFDKVDGRFNKIDERINGIDSQLSRMESRQEVIFSQTGHLTEFREEINEKLEGVVKKEDMRYYEAKLLEHDKDIFNIQRRA